MVCPARARRTAFSFATACAGLFLFASSAVEAAPARVVSINLCTDQMAMLLAAEGQLVSVSRLAADPAVSMMSEEAASFVLNDGLAEQIFLMKPDLVLAGSYSTRTTVDLLKRLGIAVAEFSPASSFDDVRQNLDRLGILLDRREAADTLISAMDASLDVVEQMPVKERSAALYYANGYTSGESSLAGEMIARLGLHNIAGAAGVDAFGRLPLERLVMAAPEVIIGGDGGYDAPALASAGFSHPAFMAVAGNGRYVDLPSRYTICGGPFNVAGMTLLAEQLAGDGDEE